MALHQPQWASYYAGTRHSDVNNPWSFEWTNDSRSLTSAAQLLTTNSLHP
jgi:hypothetical protein